MIQKKAILEQLQALNSIKELAQSYEEIAVVRMQKIRNSVLKTRDFLADLSDVYVDLKASYLRELQDLLSRRKAGDTSLVPMLQKQGKTLMVYLASNGKLYGSVTQKTYRLFIEDLRKDAHKGADILIIGRAGKEMYEETEDKRAYDYFDLPDTSVDIGHIKELMVKFIQYERVYVYYGKFDNVIRQSPIATSISGEEIFETEVKSETPREDKFIFEPTLDKIFSFFENQVMVNLFSQTLLENQLARHASRVDAMEEALVHIEEEGKKLNRQKNQLRHMTQNRKQLEMFSGLVLWSE